MLKLNAFILIIFAVVVSLFAQPLAGNRDKYLGNIIKSGASAPDDFLDLWNQVTPENGGKWGSVESNRGQMQWIDLDRAYDFAQENDLPFRQHTFVWAQQQPGWIADLDPESQFDEVEEWIRLFGERYYKVDFIDVVNEPLHEVPSYKDALGGDGETGWDWVIRAFELAREFNPDAELNINEYGVLRGWVSTSSYLEIINLLKDRNLIDGIGLQGHFLETTSKSAITSRLNQLAKAELPIHITEFDLRIADDEEQLAKYQEIFPAIFEHDAVKGITLWGYNEGQIWREEAFLVRSDGSERPALQWLRSYFDESQVKENHTISNGFVWNQNYPNPFNPTTTISFMLPTKSKISLNLYSLNGTIVKKIADGEYSRGQHDINFDAGQLSTGVYLYKLEADGFVDIKKMTLVK